MNTKDAVPGDTWHAISEDDDEGFIYLERREKNFSFWRAYVPCTKISGLVYMEWFTSYEMARDRIPLYNSSGKPLIFKKDKNYKNGELV